MKSDRQGWTDLLLEGNLKQEGGPARPMALVDAPKVERDERRRGFDWRPTLLLVAAMAVVLAAAAYL